MPGQHPRHTDKLWLRRVIRQGQPEAKRAAAFRAAFEPDPATVPFDHGLDQAQPQPRAGDGLSAGFFGPVKTLEIKPVAWGVLN